MDIIKKLSTSQKIALISLMIITTISLLYLFLLNNQRRLSQCKYLYEQGILSPSAHRELTKLRDMKDSGVSEEEVNNYYHSLANKTQEDITNILGLKDEDGDLSKVTENCSNFLINP